MDEAEVESSSRAPEWLLPPPPPPLTPPLPTTSFTRMRAGASVALPPLLLALLLLCATAAPSAAQRRDPTPDANLFAWRTLSTSADAALEQQAVNLCLKGNSVAGIWVALTKTVWASAGMSSCVCVARACAVAGACAARGVRCVARPRQRRECQRASQSVARRTDAATPAAALQGVDVYPRTH